MRIGPDQPAPAIAAAARPSIASENDSASAPAATDAATLSAHVAEAAGLVNVVAAVPDVRAERIATLQQQIQSGTYTVDTNLLAERLLDVL